MTMININNLSFAYDGSSDLIFDNVSLQLDTDWRLGLVGRNGRGKTTLLRLLLGQYEYSGRISAPVKFDYFPFSVDSKNKNAVQIAQQTAESRGVDFESWQFEKELSLLEVSEDCLTRPFETLSGGEQTKILLASLLLFSNNFLLIDEPTNHLDAAARAVVSRYLSGKKGYILVSHDRDFLDGCIDHIMSINRADIVVQSGNFSTWLEEKSRQDAMEARQNQRLVGEIDRLKQAAKQKNDWSEAAEKKKKGAADKGFMGAKAARQMKTAKIIEKRQDRAIEDKSSLLKNIDITDTLRLPVQKHSADYFVVASGLTAFFGDRQVTPPLNFAIKQGERVLISGKNGSGKSTLLKILVGQDIHHTGTISMPSGLKISYVPQDTSFLQGTPLQIAGDAGLDPTLYLAMLAKLDFGRQSLDKPATQLSAGQKKKLLIAKSLCEKAHLYIWDEPLNYIDIFSRLQIENLILDCCPTLVFVEHDKAFSQKIATEAIRL